MSFSLRWLSSSSPEGWYSFRTEVYSNESLEHSTCSPQFIVCVASISTWGVFGEEAGWGKREWGGQKNISHLSLNPLSIEYIKGFSRKDYISSWYIKTLLISRFEKFIHLLTGKRGIKVKSDRRRCGKESRSAEIPVADGFFLLTLSLETSFRLFCTFTFNRAVCRFFSSEEGKCSK